MRLTLGLLADGANQTADSKLNILGEFNIVLSMQFPCAVPSMALVFRLEAEGSEPADHAFSVQLLDEDRNLVRPLLEGHFTLSPSQHEGLPRRVQGIFPIVGAVFERPGTYVFDVLVDNERPETPSPIEVHVVQLPAQA
jgi:hypothetical protein